MKDKPNVGGDTPVADQADSARLARDETEAAEERSSGSGTGLESPPDDKRTGPSEPNSPDAPEELSPQLEDVALRHVALPAPGLPDEPTLAGEPVISAAEAADSEPAVEADLEWQPEVAPDPELLTVDNADAPQPMQAETIAQTRGQAPWSEHVPVELPTSDEPAAFAPVQGAPIAERTEAEPTSVADGPAHIETQPFEATLIEAPWPEHAPANDEPPDEKSTEPPGEQPLRDRIPSVLPVELEAIKTPLAVPVFEPPPRPPEAAQPSFTAPSRAPESALAAASVAGAATAIPRRADAIDETAPSPAWARDIMSSLRPALRLAALTLGALACLVLVLIVLYRWVNPPASTLMVGQWLTGTRIDQRWVPLSRISPYLQRAVITSEDGRFCQHYGVDWGEIEEAIERARDGIPRGGSTISMQVVKNLFLWPSKSYVRKALEFPLTFAIELAWSKPRILEIYLNIAEWGPGVFGAEAAARYHFGKSAATLTPSQAALLAVSLPNPIERRAGAPGPGTLRLATTIHARMMANPGNASCVQARR